MHIFGYNSGMTIFPLLEINTNKSEENPIKNILTAVIFIGLIFSLIRAAANKSRKIRERTLNQVLALHRAHRPTYYKMAALACELRYMAGGDAPVIDVLRRVDSRQSLVELRHASYIWLAETLLKSRFEESPQVVYQCILSKVHRLHYHGTNLAALSKIQQYGLNADRAVHDYSAEELVEILGEKPTPETVYAHRDQTRRCFYATTASDVAVEYACNSPEWFFRLIGEENGHDAVAACKSFIASTPHLPKARAEALFRKYWALYGNKKEAVVVAFAMDEGLPAIPDGSPEYLKTMLKIYLSYRGNTDIAVDKTIPFEKLHIFRLRL